jgi:hypothetical protein
VNKGKLYHSRVSGCMSQERAGMMLKLSVSLYAVRDLIRVQMSIPFFFAEEERTNRKRYVGGWRNTECLCASVSCHCSKLN